VGKNKKRRTGKGAGDVEQRDLLLDMVDAIEGDARDSFEKAFERLEERAARKIDKIVRRTRRDSDFIAGVLQDLVGQAEASSQRTFVELGEANALLTRRYEDSLAQVNARGAAIEELFVKSEKRGHQTLERLDALAADVGARVAEVTERLEEVARQQQDKIRSLTAEVSERIAVSERAVTEVAADADVKIRRGIEVALSSAARDAEQLRDQARAKLDENLARVEAESHRVMDRMRKDLARSGTDADELRTRREMIEQLDEELVNALVESAQAAWQRLAEAEERSVAELQGAAKRVTELLARVDADTSELRSSTEHAARLAQDVEARAGAVDARIAEIEARIGVADPELQCATKQASELDTQLDVDGGPGGVCIAPSEPTGHLVPVADREPVDGQLAPEETTARALAGDESTWTGTTGADPPASADGTPLTWPPDWLPERDRDSHDPDGAIAGGSASSIAWTPSGGLYDTTPGEDDPDFFRRLAEELRVDPSGDASPGGSLGKPVTLPPPAPYPVWPSEPPARGGHGRQTDPAPLAPGWASTAAVASEFRSVPVLVPCHVLAVAVEQLGLYEPDRAVRIEVMPTPADLEYPARVRLVTYDSVGWWEWFDVPAYTSAESVAPLVVQFDELAEAVEANTRFGLGSDVALRFDGSLTVGNHLLVPVDVESLPTPPTGAHRVETIDLERAARNGMTVESQLGCLLLTPHLVSHVRRRHAAAVDLVSVDGVPHLSARVAVPGADQVLRIAARLYEAGEDGAPEVVDRRQAGGNETTQLVSALTATTTPEQLMRLLKVGVGYVRRRVAAHPSLPTEMIAELVATGTEAMRAAATSNPSIAPETLELAATDRSEIVRSMAAANASVQWELLERLARDESPHVRGGAARNPRVSSALLDELAADEVSEVRAAVAGRRDVAREILEALSQDADPLVCGAVAANPSCPTELLDELVGIAPEAVLGNPNTSKSLLVAGALLDVVELRAKVAGNPMTPAKGLRFLARDQDLEVLRAVVNHPQTPAPLRRRVQRRLPANDAD